MDIFRQKNKLSNQLLDSIPLAYTRVNIVYDKSGKPVDIVLLEVNSAFKRIAGINRDELIGRNLTELFPQLKEKMFDLFSLHAEKSRKSSEYEFEIYIEQSSKWYDVFIKVIDEDSFTVVYSDCSKRKTIENELKQSESRFKSLYENATIGIYRTTPDGRILLANPTMVKLLGYSSFDELAKRNLESEGFNPEYPRSDFIKKLEVDGEIAGIEASWKTKDGKLIYISETAKAIKDNNGNIIYYEGTVEDITEKKIAELKITDLNHLFVELGIDPLVNIDTIVRKTGELLKGACSIYSCFNKEEKALLIWSDYNAPEDIIKKDNPEGYTCFEATMKAKNKAVVINNLQETEYINTDPNVKKYGFQSYLGFPVDINQKAVGSLCLFDLKPRTFSNTDVNIISTLAKALSLEHQRYVVENSLKDARVEAENANRAKNQFLSNMSHEIRTPLNGIMGFSEMLISQESDERKARMLKMVENAGNHLLHIVNDIFEYSKIESGKLTVRESDFYLSELIKDTIEFFSKDTKLKNLQVIFEEEEIEEDNLFGDSYKLTQILANVIGNAVKFTGSGYIMITAKSKLINDKVQTSIIVEDTGIGIDNDQFDIIFDEFRQLDFYLTKKSKGTGLGLSITKKLLDLINGNISVESELGKGSKFIIEIPFQPEKSNIKEVIMDPIVEKSEPELNKINILLAEDNEANQFLIKAISKSKGWNVTVVDDGEEAVEEYNRGNYDLILMDVQMPNMNGYEATKIIRDDEKSKGIHTPIIALTAYAMKSDKDMCIEAGMDDYISKPFKRQQFLDTIANALKAK
ncbi:MAG: response regulator [Bacteroidales bacterium]|nr:response regulator [Bacteroidales bacterium]